MVGPYFFPVLVLAALIGGQAAWILTRDMFGYKLAGQIVRVLLVVLIAASCAEVFLWLGQRYIHVYG